MEVPDYLVTKGELHIEKKYYAIRDILECRNLGNLFFVGLSAYRVDSMKVKTYYGSMTYFELFDIEGNGIFQKLDKNQSLDGTMIVPDWALHTSKK